MDLLLSRKIKGNIKIENIYFRRSGSSSPHRRNGYGEEYTNGNGARQSVSRDFPT